MNDRTLDPNDHEWMKRRIAELEAQNERLLSASHDLIAHANGDFECDDGERGWLVHDDFMQSLKEAIATDPEDSSDE